MTFLKNNPRTSLFFVVFSVLAPGTPEVLLLSKALGSHPLDLSGLTLAAPMHWKPVPHPSCQLNAKLNHVFFYHHLSILEGKIFSLQPGFFPEKWQRKPPSTIPHPHHRITEALVGQHRATARCTLRQAQDAMHAHSEATVQVHGLDRLWYNICYKDVVWLHVWIIYIYILYNHI